MATQAYYAADYSPQFASRAKSWQKFGLLPAVGLLWALYAQQNGLATSYYETWSGFILPATLVAASVIDLVHHKIPNYITYPAFAWLASLSLVQWAVQAADGGGPLSIGAARWTSILGALPPAEMLTGFMICFGLMFGLFVCAASGGGDVKLAAVIGAALGAESGLTAIVVTHIAAGTFALAFAMIKFGPVHIFVSLGRKIGHFLFPVWVLPTEREENKLLSLPIPLSPFFLVGVIYAVWAA